MSPDLLALARAYVALPGAPRLLATLGHGPVWVRSDDTGVGWCWDMHESRWLPDLTDDATGGVMLGMLGPVMEPMVWYSIDAGYCIRRIGEPFGPCCDTLAEACARVAVALGRAA